MDKERLGFYREYLETTADRRKTMTEIFVGLLIGGGYIGALILGRIFEGLP